MTGPLVSVLVPLYNHERYLEACLRSIRDEGYGNLELIVLDDGSTDRSLALATAWLEANRDRFARVKLWTQPNAGLCRTLNRLVQEARGAYLTILASDDALLPGGIQLRVGVLEQRPELLAVCADAQVIDERGGLLAPSAITAIHHGCRPALADPRRFTKELLLRWSIPGPVFLARKCAWDPVAGVGPYDESLSLEDREFYLRLLSRRALTFLDAPVAQYLVHSLNFSRNPAKDDLDSPQRRIVSDVHQAAVNNLHRFRGLNKALLFLLIKNYQYKSPRRIIPYRMTRTLVKAALFMNSHGLLGS